MAFVRPISLTRVCSNAFFTSAALLRFSVTPPTSDLCRISALTILATTGKPISFAICTASEEVFAIASFDDTYFAPLLEPALTAISYDTPYMGERSARLLVDAIESEQPGYEEVRIGVKHVPRRSCGCEYDFMPALDAEAAALA